MIQKAIIIFLLTLVTSVAFSTEKLQQEPVRIAYAEYMPFFFKGAGGQPRGILVDAIVRSWTGETKPTISRPSFKKVVIANCVDSVPFHYNDEGGRPVGMLVDLWRLWSEKTGIQIEFRSSAWPGTLEMVRDGEADIHAGCFYSEERDKYLDYAAALRSCDTHFFFHDSIFGLKTLHDLIGFKIGVIEKDYAVDYLNQELPEATLAEYPSNEALFDAVERGEVRVFVYDTPATLYYLYKKGLRERSWQRDDFYCCVTDVGHL